MTLKIDNTILHIEGNIVNNDDFNAIKTAMDTMKSSGTITMDIKDSLVISSSLIGYLMKLINQEGVNLSIIAGNDTLYELLGDIGLLDAFNVRKG